MRLCRCGCGTDLDKQGLRSDALYASQACKMRHRRAKASKSARRAASRNKGGTRRRRRTRYALIPAKQLKPVTTVEARDRRAAAKMADGELVAIPERSLRLPA